MKKNFIQSGFLAGAALLLFLAFPAALPVSAQTALPCNVSAFTNPSSIVSGGTTTLQWSSNCDNVSIYGGGISTTPRTPSGQITVGPLATNTFFSVNGISANGGNSVNASVTVTPAPNCVINSFSANPTTVAYMGTSTFTWSTTGCSNVSLSGPAVSSSLSSGSATTGPLTATGNFTLSASTNIATITRSVTVTVTPVVVPNCTVTSFTVNSPTITAGNSTQLSWTTSNCTSLTLSGGIFSGAQSLNSSGTNTGTLNSTTTYTINAVGPNSAFTRQVTVTVTPVIVPNCTINSFTANPTVISAGGNSNLSWTTSNCTNVTISIPFLGAQPVNGSVNTGALFNNTAYTLTASGVNTVNQSLTVTVNPIVQNNCVINSFTANPTVISAGGNSTLSWTTSNCTNVTISIPFLGAQPVNGSLNTGALSNTTSYTLSASGVNTVNQSLTVTVNPIVVQNCVINYFNADQTTVPYGGSASLRWSTSGCVNVSVMNSSILSTQLSGTVGTGVLTQTTTFNLAASSSNGTIIRNSVGITVTPQIVCTIGSFVANPMTVAYMGVSTLSWNTSGCTSATVSGPSAFSSQLSGSTTTGPLVTTGTFTLTGNGSTGPVTQTVTINVNPIVPNCAVTGFQANPSIINSGGSSVLSWTTSNCTSLTLSGGIFSGAQSLNSSGTNTGALNTTTTYVINAVGQNGLNFVRQVTVAVNATPSCVINSFTANPTTITAGGASTLFWDTTNCSSFSVNGNQGWGVTPTTNFSLNTGSLSNTTTFILSASGVNTVTQQVTVVVTPQIPNCSISSFMASPISVVSGNSSQLSWSTSNCISATLSGGIFSGSQSLNSSGTSTGALYATTSYVLTATGVNGNNFTRQATVGVNPVSNLCNVAISANDMNVAPGGSTIISWSSTNCSPLSVTGPNLATPISVGTITTLALYSNTTYTILGYNPDGTTVTKSVTVTVTAVAPNCVIGSFTANPTSILSGNSSSLSWATSNCTSVSISGGSLFGNQALNSNGLSTGILYGATTYTLTATGVNTVTMQTTVSVNNVSNCVISYFNASPSNVASGNSSSLSWATSNCTSVSISGGNISGGQSLNSSGINTGAIYGTTTYVLTASGSNTVSSQTTVSVNNYSSNCVINYFNSSPSSVSSGGSSNLTWGSSNCSNFTLSGPNYSNTPVSGYSMSTGALFNTATFTLTGSGTNTTTSTTTVYVNNNNNNNGSYCSINGFYASPTQVPNGGSTTLYWSTSGCVNVNVSGPGMNSNNNSGSMSVGPIYGLVQYNITASANNSVNQSVTVSNSYINQQNSAPTATTAAATNVSGNSVTLNGYINSNNTNCGYSYSSNCSTYPSYYFQYGTNQYSLYNTTPTQSFNTSSGNVYASLNNLTPGSTYYFQLVATNSYGSNYGGVLSFYTGNNVVAGSPNIVTSVATNVTDTSARLNALILGPQNTSGMSVYFDYGTSPALDAASTTHTNIHTISQALPTNYYDIVNTEPSTVYYYRIVATAGGQTYTGSTSSFTSATTGANVNPVVITKIISGTGAGSASATLNISDQTQTINPGDTVNYMVNYQNVSNSSLSNVVLHVILPTGLTFKQASQGIPTTNNTIETTLGTLAPNAQGVVTITATADSSLVAGNSLVTTATLSFLNSAKAQDSVVAYATNTVSGTAGANLLAGLALFGAGFFPTSLLGWILLIGLILILVFVSRYYFHRGNAARIASVPPVTHVHYDSAPVPHSPTVNMGNSNYPPNNLPH